MTRTIKRPLGVPINHVFVLTFPSSAAQWTKWVAST